MLKLAITPPALLVTRLYQPPCHTLIPTLSFLTQYRVRKRGSSFELIRNCNVHHRRHGDTVPLHWKPTFKIIIIIKKWIWKIQRNDTSCRFLPHYITSRHHYRLQTLSCHPFHLFLPLDSTKNIFVHFVLITTSSCDINLEHIYVIFFLIVG